MGPGDPGPRAGIRDRPSAQGLPSASAGQWGACWLACELYRQLGLDGFWAEKLADSREGTCWRHVLQTLVYYLVGTPKARGKKYEIDLLGQPWKNARDKFAAIQMVDVHFPTTDGRTLILSRYTQPEADQKLLFQKLGLPPDQPPPKITSHGSLLS